MKRIVLLAVALLLVLPFSGAWAQDDDGTITAESQRYSLTAPAGWYASSEVVFADLQGIFPAESLTLADSEATLEPLMAPDVEPFELTEFTGAAIVTTVWPADLLEVTGLDPATFGTLIALGADGESTSEEVALGDVTGTVTRIDNGARTLYVAPLVDKSGNMLLLVGLAEASQASNVDTVINSLAFRAIGETATASTELAVPVALLADTLDVMVPAGWWVMETPDVNMAAPDFDAAFVEAIDTGDFTDVSGTFLLGMLRDKSDFPDEVYDADGRLRPDVFSEVVDLAEMLGMSTASTDFGEVDITSAEWSNENGVSGLQLDMASVENNLVFQMIVLDNDADLAVMAAMSTADNWEIYQPTVDAIFKSVQFVAE